MSYDLDKYGPFGRYNGVEKVNNATVNFTGSNKGAAAFIIGQSCTGSQPSLPSGRRRRRCHPAAAASTFAAAATQCSQMTIGG